MGLGVVGMIVIVGIMTALGLLDWTEASTVTGGRLAKIILNRLASGLAVGFIEETMLRGVMFAAIQRESGAKTAIVLTSIIYSAVHFLASYHIAPDQVTSSSGLDLLAGNTAVVLPSPGHGGRLHMPVRGWNGARDHQGKNRQHCSMRGTTRRLGLGHSHHS